MNTNGKEIVNADDAGKPRITQIRADVPLALGALIRALRG
jgi:hypothetical protein